MTQDQFQELRAEMQAMEVRFRDHSFNRHNSICSYIGGVDERLSKVEIRLVGIEADIKTIKGHLLNGLR